MIDFCMKFSPLCGCDPASTLQTVFAVTAIRTKIRAVPATLRCDLPKSLYYDVRECGVCAAAGAHRSNDLNTSRVSANASDAYASGIVYTSINRKSSKLSNQCGMPNLLATSS